MKAYLINAESKVIDTIEINGMDDIKQQVGYDTIESDSIGDAGDTLFFDEECFLRGSAGRFQIDKLIPVSGKGIVVGYANDSFSDVTVSLDELNSRIKYL